MDRQTPKKSDTYKKSYHNIYYQTLSAQGVCDHGLVAKHFQVSLYLQKYKGLFWGGL